MDSVEPPWGRDAVAAEVRNFISDSYHYRQAIQDLTEVDLFVESGVMDSFGFLNLVTFLEDRFGIQVSDDEVLLDNLGSIARVADYVTAKLHP